MAVSRAVLTEAALPMRSAAQVLAFANALLCTNNPMNLFVTCCYGLYDPSEGSLVYACAGHTAPLVRRGHGAIDSLPLTYDLALGVLPNISYTEHHLQLAHGDTLLMYTDGVTEAFSLYEEAYGNHRLYSWLSQEHPAINAKAMVDGLVLDVASFVNGAEASDDLTCLVLCHH